MTVILRTMATYGPRQPAIEGDDNEDKEPTDAANLAARRDSYCTWFRYGLPIGIASHSEIGWSGPQAPLPAPDAAPTPRRPSRSRPTSRPAPRATGLPRQLLSYRRLRVSAAGRDVNADGDRVPQLPVDPRTAPAASRHGTRDAATEVWRCTPDARVTRPLTSSLGCRSPCSQRSSRRCIWHGAAFGFSERWENGQPSGSWRLRNATPPTRS